MVVNPFPLIWRADPFHLSLPSHDPDLLLPLKQAVPRFGLFSLSRQACVGRVTRDRLLLRHQRPFIHNDMAPVLDAAYLLNESGPRLIGVYRMSWYSRWFMTIWFGFLMILLPIFVIVGLIGLVTDGALSNLVFILSPLAMIAFGLALLQWGHRSWDEDKHVLESFVASRLGVPANAA